MTNQKTRIKAYLTSSTAICQLCDNRHKAEVFVFIEDTRVAFYSCKEALTTLGNALPNWTTNALGSQYDVK